MKVDPPGKFHVHWTEDWGWAVNEGQAVFEAPSMADAQLTWIDRVRDRGYRCHPAYGRKDGHLCRVPKHLEQATDQEVHAFFENKPDYCEAMGAGK